MTEVNEKHITVLKERKNIFLSAVCRAYLNIF